MNSVRRAGLHRIFIAGPYTIDMPSAFSRILLAYDDSAGSRIALEYACALARAGAALTVAHAVDEYSVIASATTAGGFAAIDPTPLVDELDERGAALLRAAVDACATHGVAADHVFLRESAAAAIEELARAREIDLIVVGTHGREGVARVALGSVAEEIVRASKVPVLTLTAHATSPHHDQLFARALVALDDSGTSHVTLTIAAHLRQDLATHLTLCNVIDTRDLLAKAAVYGYDERPIETSLHADAAKVLEGLVNASDIAVSPGDLLIVEGEPAAAIEHAAMQRNCDLIVIGSHGRRGLGRLFLGSVAEAVLRRSSVPVLVIPSGMPHASLSGVPLAHGHN